ncbi:MAG TPA: DUF5985 family protein [Sphingomicrobium sp.]
MGDVFPTAVYILCFLTSAACAWLLGRSYRASGAPLLLWSSVGFVFLALNNLALVLDLVVWPIREVDLRLPRLLLALAAACSMLFGFIWRVEEE